MNDERAVGLLNTLKAHPDTVVRDIANELSKNLLDIRYLLGELAIGLEDDDLNQQVENALGWNTEELEGEEI